MDSEKITKLLKEEVIYYDDNPLELKESLAEKINGQLKPGELDLILASVDLSDLHQVGVNKIGIAFVYKGDGDGFNGDFYSIRKHKFIPYMDYIGVKGLLVMDPKKGVEKAKYI